MNATVRRLIAATRITLKTAICIAIARVLF